LTGGIRARPQGVLYHNIKCSMDKYKDWKIREHRTVQKVILVIFKDAGRFLIIQYKINPAILIKAMVGLNSLYTKLFQFVNIDIL